MLNDIILLIRLNLLKVSKAKFISDDLERVIHIYF
jgi:hypothetical protein